MAIEDMELREPYPQELKDFGLAALRMCSFRLDEFDSKTLSNLETMKRYFLRDPARGAGNGQTMKQRQQEKEKKNPDSRICLKASIAHQGLVFVIRKESFHDQEDEERTQFLPRINRQLMMPSSSADDEQAALRLVNDYIPPAIPPVPGLAGQIGTISLPFEKQLTESDVRNDQSRLTMNKADVKRCLLPLLSESENLVKGIEVVTYDPYGSQFRMVFKMWASKIHVLTKGWQEFYNKHNLEKDKDFVTIWMFRNLATGKLCFVITWRRLPISQSLKRKREN